MKEKLNMTKFLLLPAFILLASCGGKITFNDYARAGDTVAVASGMQPNFAISNTQVDFYIPPRADRTVLPDPITDIPFATYNPGHVDIRGIVNFYPDPVSSIIVSRQTNQDLTLYARNYAQTTGFITNNDHDWFQTTVFVDLPGNLPSGQVEIVVTNGQGDFNSSIVEIVGPGGTESKFSAWNVGDLSKNMFESLARVSHYTIDFDSATIPHAIEVNMSHLPNTANGGSGEAFAINPLGYKKNLSWTDDGTNMKAILLPSEASTVSSMQDYKFYVAGGINGLIIDSVAAYDVNGNVVSGVTATVTERN